ncbi:MAG: LuxR C-terminal-related transcriptional regulator, partial [Pseudomonadales bacterium]
LAGSSYIPPSAIRMMGYEPNEESQASDEQAPESVRFSPKQRAVFDQLMLGVPNKVIADRLNMAEGTVKTHLHSIYQILQVRNRAQAILKSRQLRLIA